MKKLFYLLLIPAVFIAFGISAHNTILNQPSGTPPVGWWKMDEETGQTVRDYSVNGYNGTVTNGGYGVTSTDGKIGKALSFDGVDDKVTTPNNGLQGNSLFTIEVWIKVQPGSTDGWIIGKYDSGTQVPFDFYISGGLVGTRIGNTIGEFYLNAVDTVDIRDGQWHHVVFVNTPSVPQNDLYRDGVLVATDNTTAGTIASATSHNITIGAAGSNEAYFNGTIDDVRIYNYARTAEQILQDYRAGAYRTIVNTSVPSSWWTDGLMGYWNFDGPNTTSTNGTRDTSGNNNWGAFSGGVNSIASNVVGQALNFDGVNGKVNVSHNNFDFGLTDFSVEMWIKVISIPNGMGGQTAIFQKHTNTSAGYYATTGSSATNPVLTLIMFTGSSFSQYEYRYTATGLTLNTWYHWVVAVDRAGNTITNYLNGVADNGTLNVVGGFNSATNLTNTTGLTMGYAYWSNDLYGNIQLDELRIYSRALSASEIMEHYLKTRRNLRI